MPSSREALTLIAAFLRGDVTRWSDLALDAQTFLDLCREHEVEGLCFERLSKLDSTAGWPRQVWEELSDAARTRAAEELLRKAEIRRVVAALADAGIRPILLKGTPLAYTVYDSPASRPRADTDVIVSGADVEAARQVMRSLSYVETVQCHELLSQFEVQRCDRFGVIHAFDVHWSISTQPVFAGLLTYDALLLRAVAVPALGGSAVAPCRVDALLLSCVHPAMHHRNDERLLWILDIHLLASGLSPAELDEFEALARMKKVVAICRRGLQQAQAVFGTLVAADLIGRLKRTAGPEPSAAYLASERRWHHETIASLRALPRLGDRARLVREVLLPSPGYMLGAYGLRDKPLGTWLLPALYVHRNVQGAWKILIGKK
jgi:hypothetical protein